MPALGTRALKLKVGTTFFDDSVSNVAITADGADTDFVSFAVAATGGAREYKLTLTLRQNTDTTSLWYYAWNSPGTTVPIEVWPNGVNTTAPTVPTAAFPKVAGSVVITEPDGTFIGGEANASVSSVFTTEVEWTFIAKPVMTIA